MASVFDPEMHEQKPITPYSAKRELIEKCGGLPPVPPPKPFKLRFKTELERVAHVQKILDRTKPNTSKRKPKAGAWAGETERAWLELHGKKRTNRKAKREKKGASGK